MSARTGSALSPQPDPTPEWPTGFMVLHGNRLEDLRHLLIEHVRAYPLAGLEPEWVVLQSTGMKQWLEQGLAAHEGLGVCAATRMVFPAEMLWQVYRTALGSEAVPTDLPLDRDNLVWRLLRLLPEWLSGEPASDALALQRYVQTTDQALDDTRLLQLCQQLAGLYDGYQNYRADWLRAWAEGQPICSDAQGHAHPLAPEQRWQMRLWQALIADVQATQPDGVSLAPSRAEIHQAYLRRMQGPAPHGLPKRVLVFGVSALPMQTIEALAALGRFAQVMVFVLNPCQHHWGHVVSERQLLQGAVRRRQALKAGSSLPLETAAWHAQAQPLLAAWGQQGRDFLHLLDLHDDVERYRHVLGRIDVFDDPAPQDVPAPRLQRLQSDILHLDPLPETRHPVLPHDDSIVFVRAHSAVREVEVLHDQVLTWLESDPHLQPRDILVMVPDMGSCVSLIHAVWGRFETEDPRHIPYSVSDQTGQDHPMTTIVQALLQGSQARITLDDWLSWLEVPAFAHACDFPTEEWASVREALSAAGVRWGLDGTHRVQSGVALSPHEATPNTWMHGLQRLLLAQAQGHRAEASWQGIWPAPGDCPISARALGALCHSLRTLQQVLQQVQAPRTPAAWVQDLQRLVDAVLLAPTERDAKALMGLTAPLQAWLQACQTAALTTPVSLTLVRTHWLSSLSEMTAGQRFLGGGVQFATLLPMRSIPFQRVCLLGMNDGAYPRQQPLNDFDLMRAPAQRRPGDRSRREDDRYLFLEAVLCARQSLYISWQGWQAHDQSPLYPSVLVGQLIDHLNAAHEAPVPVQEAPMQAFSRQYFERPEGPWRTYATDWAWARGWQPKAKPAPVASSPAPVGSTESAPWPNALKLRDLIDLLRQPVEVFYRHRLGLRWQAPEQELPDAEPFELGAIDQHRLVAQALAHPDSFPAQARSSGQLPLGAMAQRPLQQLQSQIKVLNDRLHRSLSGAAWQEWPEQSLHWTAPSTTTSPVPALQATLGGPGWHLNEQGEILQTLLRPGVLMKKQVLQLHPLLTTWAQHLMANACGLPCTTHVLCLDQARVLPTLSTQRAGELLVKLLQAYQHAWSMPMAVPGRTACHWLAQVHKSSSRDEDERRLSAHGDSRGMYMGSRHSPREAERLVNPVLRRHAPDYEQAQGPLEQWAPVLYLDLILALQGQVPPGDSDA